MKANKKTKIILLLICILGIGNIVLVASVYKNDLLINNKIETNKNILATVVGPEDIGDGATIPESTTNIDYNNICSNVYMTNAIRIIGYVIQIIRWIVPMIIIVLGMVDFGKAALSNDEKATSKATGALIRRIIAGVVVFVLPTIIMAVLNVAFPDGVHREDDSNFGRCTKCLFKPSVYCK